MRLLEWCVDAKFSSVGVVDNGRLIVAWPAIRCERPTGGPSWFDTRDKQSRRDEKQSGAKGQLAAKPSITGGHAEHTVVKEAKSRNTNNVCCPLTTHLLDRARDRCTECGHQKYGAQRVSKTLLTMVRRTAQCIPRRSRLLHAYWSRENLNQGAFNSPTGRVSTWNFQSHWSK